LQHNQVLTLSAITMSYTHSSKNLLDGRLVKQPF
jgi:hypothetical protein